jgi:hypothetical protein
MKVIEWVAGGVRQDTAPSGAPLFFYADHTLLCERHARGMRLRPFTSMHRDAGFGQRGCPFCPVGALEGQFARHRSQTAVCAALDELDELDELDQLDQLEDRNARA